LSRLTFSFGRPKEKGNKKKKRRFKTKAGIFIQSIPLIF